MKNNLSNATQVAKYKTGDFVLIDKLFSTSRDSKATMEKIEKPLIAIVEKVTYTSTGPNYKLQLVDNKENLNLRICYWETDILSAFDI